MKDNFSRNSSDYAKYRPDYPQELFQYIRKLAPGNAAAWDCGTGNGQVASALTNYFERIEATDLSSQQISHAILHPQIRYSVALAEKTNFANSEFDLIAVGQALHWFNLEKFYAEADRVLKPGGILAVFGYPVPLVDEPLNSAFLHFYTAIIGPYWDKERHHIDEKYASLPFPYEEIPHPEFFSRYQWTFEQFMGFLSTWSGVAHYKTQRNEDPIARYHNELREAWGATESKKVEFEIFCKIGRKP